MVSFIALPLAGGSTGVEIHELGLGESSWSGHLRPNATVQVKGAVGDVGVVASEGDAFTVEVKRGSEGTVVPRIVVVETDQGAVVCADYIAKAGQPSPCGSGKGRTRSAWSTKGYARVDFTISVPRGVSVEIDTDGNINIAPLGASVSASAGNGNVHATADGKKFIGQTLRGNVDVTFTSEPIDQKAKISVLQGNVRIVLPESRRVAYQLYTHFAPVRSVYELKGGPQKAEPGETPEQRAYRKMTDDDYVGTLGPSSGPWLRLEVYVTIPENSSIEIAASR